MGGLCQQVACSDCGAGQVCVAGQCQDSACAGVDCPTGQVCEAGECAADPCQGVYCGPGEACVIPAGFKGVFEVLEAVTKHYVFVKRGEMG